MRRNSNSGRFLDQTGPAPGPPESLKRHGRALWSKIQEQYDIRDSGGLEMLGQACNAADRAAQCAKKIEAEGLVVTSASGTPRDHPLIKHELAARAFVTKTLRALGLNVEPLRRGPGRPVANAPVPYGISVEDGEDDDGGIETNSN
jgi:P27 family predicted phage terminase small subunit